MTLNEFKKEVGRGFYTIEEIAYMGQEVSDSSVLHDLCRIFLDNIEDIERDFCESIAETFDIDISLE